MDMHRHRDRVAGRQRRRCGTDSGHTESPDAQQAAGCELQQVTAVKRRWRRQLR
ncbi:MAG: hypothetical protein WKF73_09150 [Nocardioidaceae bacterium]